MAIKKKLKHTIKIYKEKARIEILKLLGFTYRKQRRRPIIFVLNSGRCGSTSVTKILNQYSNFLAFHEEIKPLIWLSTKLAENPEKKQLVYAELNQLFANRLWEANKDQIIIHSDHRLWNLVPYLTVYFPNAFFIHLIRNPIDSVKSFMQRNWYLSSNGISSKYLFEKYRLYGDKVNDVSFQIWQNYNQSEKVLWYWNYVNSTINSDLKKIEKSKYAAIRLENFVADIDKIIKTNFSIESDFNFKDVRVNKSTKEIDDNEIFEKINDAIKKHQEKLFLDYYPNLKL